MSLIKQPITGMKDILPREMEIRDYVMDVVKDTYKSFGFVSIDTPCMEHIENLLSKQGGDNEKLIFKILKRGEKLHVAEAISEEDIVDGGLRYDLTLPLARYYSNHQNELPSPFKALQMGYVWRADRPQKGRFRQFMQCDIDIIGDGSNIAEISLIVATSSLLSRLGFKDFTVRVNDRRILKAMAAYSGFSEDKMDEIFIILDKMDKIGIDGVKEELIANGFESEKVEKYIELFSNLKPDAEGLEQCKEILADYIDTDIIDKLLQIFAMVGGTRDTSFALTFDPTLVRGMGYYTGTIFEIGMEGYSGSVAGGGRYDEMIGKFTGNSAPAIGFSIGFERIIMILMENGFKIPSSKEKKIYLTEKNISNAKLAEILAFTKVERANGRIVQITPMKKNKKFQKEQLEAEGYTEIIEIYNDEQ
ncbi:MAG: histidine--tRNA ligase [Lachnospiraceae bacterium]|jgi:histidyl-tRNA synthetase|nr:histidine--tRNA ligase [Lachnospiraceae bacterium]